MQRSAVISHLSAMPIGSHKKFIRAEVARECRPTVADSDVMVFFLSAIISHAALSYSIGTLTRRTNRVLPYPALSVPYHNSPFALSPIVVIGCPAVKFRKAPSKP